MAKITVTALQTLAGDYGEAQKGDAIQIDEKAAERLAKAGIVEMEGVSNVGKLSSKGKQVTSKDLPKHMDSDKRINVEDLAELKASKRKTKIS